MCAAVQFLIGISLLILCGLFAFSAETPVDYFPFLGRAEALFPPITIDLYFWPPVSVALLTIPALWAAMLYLAPGIGRRKVLLLLMVGAVCLTPVVYGVTSWALYFSCGMLGIVLVARSLEPRFGESMAGAVSRASARVVAMPWRKFLLTIAVVHLALTIIISFSFFGAVPHVMDSVAQLFHAKIMARRYAAAPAPSVPDAFDYSHLVIRNGRWYSEYFPAHAFVVSLFVRLKAPWLANPLIGVAGLLGAASLAKRIVGDRLARLAALLLLISPWWLLMHAEGMNHATAGATVTWALVLFLDGRFLPGIASGLLFGVAFLVRPYTPVLVGIALVVFALWRAIRHHEWRWLWCTAAIGIGAIPAVLWMLKFNLLTTGDPLLPAYVAKLGRGIAPGFHTPPWGPPHTPLLGLRNVLADLNALDRWVLGLPVPLVLLAAGLRRNERLPGWVWGVPVALLIGHFTYWYVDFCFGPRFVFEALPCIAIIAAVALGELWSRAPRRLALATLFALLAAPAIWLGFYRNYGHAFYDVDDRTSRTVATAALKNALVFVPSERYSAYVWRNDPWLRRGAVYVRDRGAQNGEVIAAFPSRTAFRAEGNRLVPMPR